MERNYSFDKMKFYCIIAVVCIHTRPFKETHLGWIINTLCRNAVPLFFICSGYWFYTKFNRDYAKRHFLKISKLFICWSIFYIISDINYVYIYTMKDGVNLWSIIRNSFNVFEILSIYYSYGIIKFHLWYLTATLVVLPILYVVIKNNLISKVLILSLILNIIGIFLYNIEFEYIMTTRDGLFLGLFYMTLGAYLKFKEELIKVKIKIINKYYLFFVTMFIIISFLERFIYDTHFNKTSDYLISTIPISILIFIGFMLKNDNKDSIISKIGRNSVGIYVIHVVIMDILNLILFKSELLSLKESILFEFLYTPILIIISYVSYNLITYIKDKILNLIKLKFNINS